MRKLTLLLIFFFPLAASAQLDKLKPGMSFDEVKKNFPGMIPDASAMSSWIYTKDTVEGIKGSSEYVISQDTLLRYGFTSSPVSGPCKEFPDLKSDDYSRLMKEAISKYNLYLSLYGPPTEYKTQSELLPDSSQIPVPVYYAKWKNGANQLSIILSRPGNHKRQEMNAPPPSTEDMKPGCKYTLEIMSIGTGNYFQRSCENGITGYTFKLHHPNLSAQVENHPDSWIVADTLTCNTGAWRFTFESKKLDSYSLNITDGSDYTHKTDSAYALLKSRTMVLYNEAKKMHGKPDTLINKMLVRYRESRSSFFRHTTYFSAEWKYGDKKLFMIFDKSEGGKQFQPIFHLLLFYGRSEVEM
ncbi:MAG TPA: hypothetical protein VK809_04180 [Bacteroidia bacterium]|jgi:hypothetical protein|nr:hypothetical protein [Bacteroidia bacterium]